MPFGPRRPPGSCRATPLILQASERESVFRDRPHAGRLLATELLKFRGSDPLVLALPRGGVPVGCEIARCLGATLDVIAVRKIGSPHQPELGVGAIVDGEKPQVLLDESLCASLHLTRDDLEPIIERERAEMQRREAVYRAGRPAVEARGRTVIVVDDGIATGSTLRAVLTALRQRGASRVVVAVPVAAPEALRQVRQIADDVVCLHAPPWFRAVGQFYEDFSATTDEEVVRLLEAARVSEP